MKFAKVIVPVAVIALFVLGLIYAIKTQLGV